MKEKKSDDNLFHLSDGVSLRDYIDTRFNSVQCAVDKAEKSMSERLHGMNEFRDTLKDQAAKFVTREELSMTITPIINNLHELQKIADIAQGKASMKAVLFTAAMSIVALLLGIIRIFAGK